jgi:menaquinone-9 beta-reductase
MNMNRRIEPRYDAVIVGARCAGAATAMLLARSGARVLVIDRQAYGSESPSAKFRLLSKAFATLGGLRRGG